jgi:hypothetical protein
MISVVYPIYNFTEDKKHYLIDNWKLYPISLQKEFSWILVDDYSDVPILFNIDFPINLKIVRITEDKGYNIGGAKNIGIYLANSEWILQSDIDHILFPESAKKILNLELKNNHIYSFNRIRLKNDGTLQQRHPHANSFLIQKDIFWKLGGYDEDFSGHYGYEDAMLNYLINKCCVKVNTDITLYEMELLKTPNINRDTSFNLNLLREKSNNNYKNDKTLRFTWEITQKYKIED